MLNIKLISSLLLVLASSSFIIASPHLSAIVAARQFHGAQPRSFHQRSLSSPRNRRRDGNPNNLAPGSLTAAEGCGKFIEPKDGDSCYSTIATYAISLDELYAWNPSLDKQCYNLNVGTSYCVKRVVSSSTSAKSNVKSSVKSTTVKIATITSSPVAIVAAAAPTPTDADDDGDEDCSDEPDDDESSETGTETEKETTTRAAAVATTTKNPTTTHRSHVATTTKKSQTTKAASTPKKAVAAVAAQVETTTSKAPVSTSSASVAQKLTQEYGITAFLDVKAEDANPVMSWYDANSARDSTNGRGWCQRDYTDATPGFAPPLDAMLNNFNGDEAKAKEAYCGLEAVFTLKDGSQHTLYIVDAFVQTWVRTPCATDVLHDAFNDMWGNGGTDNKDDVIRDFTWAFTGNKLAQYGYNP